MEIYLFLVAATVVLARFLPQRRWYILTVMLLHCLVCGLRHPHLTGDLMKYHWQFLTQSMDDKNIGFSLFSGFISQISGGDFQLFLAVIAVITHFAAAVLIYRYSENPMLSVLAWGCLGFYLSGFSAIKQALAMGLVMLSFLGIAERRPGTFFGFLLLAGLVHRPALIFLPAGFVTEFKIDRAALLCYALAGVLLLIFREPFAGWITELYYGPGTELENWSGLGGRFVLILLMAASGALLRGIGEREFDILLHLMLLAALLQMLSGYGNLFTRLADYYFQFSILFLPAMLDKSLDAAGRRWLTAGAAVSLIGFYYVTILSADIACAADDYLNYRFLWE